MCPFVPRLIINVIIILRRQFILLHWILTHTRSLKHVCEKLSLHTDIIAYLSFTTGILNQEHLDQHTFSRSAGPLPEPVVDSN